MLTSEGNKNHCHDCERRTTCKYRISDFWLCDGCDDKRRNGQGPPPGPHRMRSSPLQMIQSIAKSIGKAGKEMAERASSKRKGLQKLTSAGSATDLLPVRPLRVLLGQHDLNTQQTTLPPASLQPPSTSAFVSPMQSLSPTSNIFSPGASDHSEASDADVLDPNENSQLGLDTLMDISSQNPHGDIENVSRKGSRRSRRLQGMEAPLPGWKCRKEKAHTKEKAPTKKKETAKNKKKKASTKPEDKSPPASDPLRCCICMKWIYAPDEEIYGSSIWNCEDCRKLPATVAELSKTISSFLQTNMDLVATLARQIATNEELRKENHELRQLANKPRPRKGNGKHLLITDATLDGISSAHEDTLQVIHEPAATFEDCQRILTQNSKQIFDKVSVVAGFTNCTNEDSIEDMSTSLSTLIQQAKTLSSTGSVQVSSVLPQVANPDTQQRIEDLNSSSERICKQLNVSFVNNDPSFRLGDGEINEGFLQDDGCTVNKAGRNKLLKNLQIQNTVKISTQAQWKTTTTTRRPNIPRLSSKSSHSAPQRAPCWNCGDHSHTSNVCVYRKRVTCYKCGKQGHKAPKCGRH